MQRKLPIQNAEFLVLATIMILAAITYSVLSQGHFGQRLIAPQLLALILIANLIPAMILIVLVGRRIAIRNVDRRGAHFHRRLLLLFSWTAAVPMLLMVFTASILVQYGLFSLSSNARTAVGNASSIARAYSDFWRNRVAGNATALAFDLHRQPQCQGAGFQACYAYQIYQRELSESAIIVVDAHGLGHSFDIKVNPYNRSFENVIPLDIIQKLKSAPVLNGLPVYSQIRADRIEAITPFAAQNVYLYVSRVDEEELAQTQRAKALVADYENLTDRSRNLQLEFSFALYAIALFIVGIAVFVALKVADNVVAPIRDLVQAVRKVTKGDLRTRITTSTRRDEIGTLSKAFNTMTARLREQTDALLSANTLLDRRRALTEAVLASVSAGVIAVDKNQKVRLINDSAKNFLKDKAHVAPGDRLEDFSPTIHQMLLDGEDEAIKSFGNDEDALTLAIKIVPDEVGHVITFDDITTQIHNQKRAAWADVARRIAHEIKNPLTPIQLAAERLSRRFGAEVKDTNIFGQLTETIIRQVGDLRRIVDEFSSFARVVEPIMREEDVVELVRQAIFLHEVAQPNIRFLLETTQDHLTLICDRRQLSQALINLIKNAIEAVETKGDKGGEIKVTLREQGSQIALTIDDNGIGLPKNQKAIFEPYVTTKANGTGLGLAIVLRIVQEHGGTLHLVANPHGGTRVEIMLPKSHENMVKDEGEWR